MSHILIADDDEVIRHSLRENLEQAGHSVALAADGCEAMQRISERLPDLIVLDVMMPRRDGFEVLKELKAQPRTASLPVVVLVARTADPAVFEGWPAGNYYVTKPFSSAALALLLAQVLQGHAPSAPLDRLLQGLEPTG